jgi:hypothetical protein
LGLAGGCRVPDGSARGQDGGGPVTQLVWRTVLVDGETFLFTSYRAIRVVNGGSVELIEALRVVVCATEPTIGTTYPGGTVVTGQHVADLVRLYKAHGREVPFDPQSPSQPPSRRLRKTTRSRGPIR